MHPLLSVMIQSRVGERTSNNAGTRTTTDDLHVFSRVATIQAKKQIINRHGEAELGCVYDCVFGERMHNCGSNRKKRWFHDVVSAAKEE